MPQPISFSLATLENKLNAQLQGGDKDHCLTNLSSLAKAEADSLSFFNDYQYREDLQNTRAGAVLLKAGNAELCPVPCLITEQPYLQYAYASQLFASSEQYDSGVHPTACVAADVRLGAGVSVGANSSIDAGTVIGDNTVICAGVCIAERVSIGAHSYIGTNVSVNKDCRLGARVIIHSGAVLGADGFGFAPSSSGWVKIAQLGTVEIGDDVEIGANATVDRGALENTVLEKGVKLDSQVHIAHNVHIGEHTVIAAHSSIAGSTRIGARCTISGQVGIVNGITVADGTEIGGKTFVVRSLRQAGRYYSYLPLMNHADWKRNLPVARHLRDMHRSLKSLEQARREENETE